MPDGPGRTITKPNWRGAKAGTWISMRKFEIFGKKLKFQNFFFPKKFDFFKFYQFSIENLLINFYDFRMIQGAKLFFLIRCIQIEKIEHERTSVRAILSWKCEKSWKIAIFHDYELESSKFLHAQRARKCARAKVFQKWMIWII